LWETLKRQNVENRSAFGYITGESIEAIFDSLTLSEQTGFCVTLNRKQRLNAAVISWTMRAATNVRITREI